MNPSTPLAKSTTPARSSKGIAADVKPMAFRWRNAFMTNSTAPESFANSAQPSSKTTSATASKTFERDPAGSSSTFRRFAIACTRTCSRPTFESSNTNATKSFSKVGPRVPPFSEFRLSLTGTP
jgi:hypothetical protein